MLLKLSALHTLGAETALIVGAWLVPGLGHVATRGKVGVLLWPLMLVKALITLMAVAILLEEPANGQLVFVVDMQKPTFVPLFACAL